jgi:hypothetical protein
MLEQFEDPATGQARLRPQAADGAVNEETLLRALTDEGVVITAVRQTAPTLDDVYSHLNPSVVRDEKPKR